MKSILVVIMCFAALGAQAQAHKCVTPAGKIEYSDTACATDAKGTLVRTDRPNSVDTRAGYAQDLSDAQDAEARNADNRCLQARGDVGHSTTRQMLRNRKAAARLVCGDAPPSEEDVARRRERIQRAATIDAINRNTAAVQAGPFKPFPQEPKRLEMRCKPGLMHGTTDCTQQ